MNRQEEKNVAGLDRGRIGRLVILRFGLLSLILMAFFFLSAGTLRYWQAWIYLAVLLIPMSGLLVYLLRKDPEVLERRMRTKEKENRQRIIVLLGYPAFLATFLLPGFDRRFGWSAVPAALVIVADAMVLAAYLLFIRVLLENRYAARVVEVEQGQRLIDTGPYAVVRHPMYAAILPIYLFSPLALGSFWTLIPASMIPLIIFYRIANEEEVLLRDLPGYPEYTQRVRHRLIPGVW